MPPLNNKQNKNRNPIINRQEKQTKQNKTKENLSTNFTLYKAYTNPWTNFRREDNQKEERIQLRILGKGDLKHNKLKK